MTDEQKRWQLVQAFFEWDGSSGLMIDSDGNAVLVHTSWDSLPTDAKQRWWTNLANWEAKAGKPWIPL